MSIINEAIKKARKEFEIKGKDFSRVLTGVDIQPAVGPRPSETKWLIIVAVSLIFVVSLLGSAVLYRHMARVNARIIETPEETKSMTAVAPHKTYPAMPLPYKNSGSLITLNGIVHGPEGKWAIINNKITKEGDLLPGGRLTLIAKDFVKIKKNTGEEILLELR